MSVAPERQCLVGEASLGIGGEVVENPRNAAPERPRRIGAADAFASVASS